MADGITNNFSQMASDIQAGLDKHHEESLGKDTKLCNQQYILSKVEQR